MMVVGAFYQVQQSLRWFVDNFAGIADWRATLSRIVNFRDALLALEELQRDVPRIEIRDDPSGNLILEDVTVLLFPMAGPRSTQATSKFGPASTS